MKFYIKSFGCRLNISESESIAYGLKNKGFLPVNNENDADFVIINTCTVTARSDSKSLHFIKKIKKQNKPILVTGCLSQTNPDYFERIPIIPINQKGNIPEIVEEVINKRSEIDKFNFKLVSQITNSKNSNQFPEPSYEKLYHSRAFIKIQDGCDMNCTFCKVRIARGKSISLSPEIVLEHFIKLLDKGFKEIVLTGINLASYNYNGFKFSDLLEKLLSIKKNFFIQLSSLEINFLDDKFFKIIKDQRIKPYFHLALQSGSKNILEKMKRPYSIDKFMETVDRLKTIKGNPFISSDIIVGFPGESQIDFEETLKVVKESKFQHMHLFPYSVREGTEASLLKDNIPDKIKKDRLRLLKTLEEVYYNEYSNSFIGKKITFISEKSYNNLIFGKSYYSLPVIYSKKSWEHFNNGEIYKGVVIGKSNKHLILI